MAAALLLIVAGITASFAMTEVWQLLLLWGVLCGTGSGMIALVLGATVATRWFAQRRGLVVGLLTASTATGQLVFLPCSRPSPSAMAGASPCASSWWGCWRHSCSCCSWSATVPPTWACRASATRP